MGRLRQVDTYFDCRQGRLKLREIVGPAPGQRVAQLIAYQRGDQAEPRLSQYGIVNAPDPNGLKCALTDTLGVLKVIEKEREVFWYQNVRIHLDCVRGLGNFLEFEAVLDDPEQQEAGQSLVRFLLQEFEIPTGDLLANSYADMD